jgi:hypothetical protein
MSAESERDGSGRRTGPGGVTRAARGGRGRWLIAGGIVAVAAYMILTRAIAGQASAGKAAKGAAPRAVPVVVAAARTGDLGV